MTNPASAATKICSKCLETRLEGATQVCRACKLAQRSITQKLWRQANPDRYSGHDKKWRAANPEKVAPLYKAYRQANPRKKAAHSTVSYALRVGRLSKGACEVCGAEKVQAHHSDYTKPLSVIWMCHAHHKKWHTQHTYDPSTYKYIPLVVSTPVPCSNELIPEETCHALR